MKTYTDIILILRPEAVFTIHNNEYDTLQWFDEIQSKPSEQEILSKMEEYQSNDIHVRIREIRNEKLAATDWWVLPDRTPTPEQLEYRQQLRDFPQNVIIDSDKNLGPNLEKLNWPVKPN